MCNMPNICYFPWKKCEYIRDHLSSSNVWLLWIKAKQRRTFRTHRNIIFILDFVICSLFQGYHELNFELWGEGNSLPRNPKIILTGLRERMAYSIPSLWKKTWKPDFIRASNVRVHIAHDGALVSYLYRLQVRGGSIQWRHSLYPSSFHALVVADRSRSTWFTALVGHISSLAMRKEGMYSFECDCGCLLTFKYGVVLVCRISLRPPWL